MLTNFIKTSPQLHSPGSPHIHPSKQELERISAVFNFEKLHQKRKYNNNTAKPDVDGDALPACIWEARHREGKGGRGEGKNTIDDRNDLGLEAKLLRKALGYVRNLVVLVDDVGRLADMVPHMARVHHEDDNERDGSPSILVFNDRGEEWIGHTNDGCNGEENKDTRDQGTIVEGSRDRHRQACEGRHYRREILGMKAIPVKVVMFGL